MALEIKDAKSASKKSNNAMTRIHFILDESGSMACCRQSTVDGFNEYINGLRSDKNGNKYKISLTKFEGGHVRRVFTDVLLKKVKDITLDDFVPAGMTNLNDAIGSTLLDMEKNPLRLKKKHNTLIIIMTDGHENASREWTKETVADLIKKKEKNDGWTVTFLGANIDTQAVSSNYAISIDNARSYTTEGMVGTMRNLGAATVMYASSAIAGTATCDMFSESSTGLTEEDWMAKDADADIDNSIRNIETAAAPSITSVTGVVNATPANEFIFEPDLKKLIVEKKTLQEAEDRFRKSGAVIKPSNIKEDSSNG